MASGKSDEMKGRVKEAAGALTGDKKLKREGKAEPLSERSSRRWRRSSIRSKMRSAESQSELILG
jgi:hypothetical protein